MADFEEFIAKGPELNLVQFLKLTGIISTGGQMKFWLNENEVILNGQLVHERRKKLHDGDCIEIKGQGTWKISLQK